MKVKLLFVALLIIYARGQNYDEVLVDFSPRLTGGALALSGEFPSAVFIRSPGTPNQPLCGGTIIDIQHVLTSAQCVLNQQNQLINTFWYTVVGGDLNIIIPTSYRVTRAVSRIYVHPNYNAITRNNDLAVLRVSEPFPEFHNTLETVVRTNRLLDAATPCRLAAWGAATNVVNALIQPELRVINSPIILSATCNAANVHANRVLNVHICAGSITATNPASGACGGNIGSGLYCNNELTGLLSFGTSCGAINNPGVYTNVRMYQEWIDAQLVRTDNPQPGWTPTPN